jgi:hypothetical protein
MRLRGCSARFGLLIHALFALSAAAPAAAVAVPVSGPRETVDTQLTTKRPNAPAGFHYRGRYHAAGDPKGDPPYMRKMISYNPRGLRFDTSVPERCGASDLELALRGEDACPPGSRLGGGTADGKLMGFPPNRLDVDFVNNTGEQIIVVRSPAFASVARGRIHPHGSVEFASPTCFPALQPPGCPVDNALQLGSDITVPPLTRSFNGVRRSYLTTPPSCPRSGHWRTPIRFWWADGSVDTVVTRQRCRRRPTRKRHARQGKRRSAPSRAAQ